jgi:hypothetical protein
VFHETVRQKAADRVKREAAAAEKAKQEKALAEQRAAEEAERLREKQKGFFSSLFTSEQAAPIVPAAANKVPAKPVQAAKPAPLPNGVYVFTSLIPCVDQLHYICLIHMKHQHTARRRMGADYARNGTRNGRTSLVRAVDAIGQIRGGQLVLARKGIKLICLLISQV